MRKNLRVGIGFQAGDCIIVFEDFIVNRIGPMLANPHSFSRQTGKSSTYAYQYAGELIKRHTNARSTDWLVTTVTGMTALINKLKLIIGLQSQGNGYK